MRPLDIDFQQPAPAPRARRSRVALLAGALLLGAAWIEYRGVEEALAAARARLHHAQGTMPSAPGGAPTGEGAARARAERGIAARLNAPWSAVLSAVEGAASPDVALLELTAVAEGATLRIAGEARDFTSLMDYLRGLEASPALSEVRLTGHETRREQGRRPVSFSLSASWETPR